MQHEFPRLSGQSEMRVLPNMNPQGASSPQCPPPHPTPLELQVQVTVHSVQGTEISGGPSDLGLAHNFSIRTRRQQRGVSREGQRGDSGHGQGRSVVAGGPEPPVAAGPVAAVPAPAVAPAQAPEAAAPATVAAAQASVAAVAAAQAPIVVAIVVAVVAHGAGGEGLEEKASLCAEWAVWPRRGLLYAPGRRRDQQASLLVFDN